MSMNEVHAPQNLHELKLQIRSFVEERAWQQFHTPKNLAMSVAIEARELMEQFQWLTAEESHALAPERLERVRHEIADVLVYLVGLADKLDIDLLSAAGEKLALNIEKYPAERVRGSSKKYDEY